MLVTVLIVDDDQGFRAAAKRLVEDVPGTAVVGEAANGEEAIQFARELRPRLVLMDLVMPGLDGLEATRRIKAEWPEAKVIILTVHDEEAYRKAAGESGADAFIVKKTLTGELPTAIQRIVGEGRARSRPCPVGECPD